MSIAALSPLSPEPPSPMLMSVTPVTPTPSSVGAPPQDGASSPGPGPSRGCLTGGGANVDFSRRTQKPPPLHTGADWKVVLHLPEIETWLRAASDRVTQLTHSVGQDADNRHVDVHLVQLKDICEDISDHVEQIHALLETEFSLKLLSYSVNIIVDIRTVQLLWHQLRVSVLVLKERLLQGLQDSNGNFTRQTDILQAFSQDQHQTRLDALTEVDDCGQLTIRCSQDYFSLDCGITAFELSDYSPSDEPEVRQPSDDPPQDSKPTTDSNHQLHNSLPELCVPSDAENHNQALSVLPTMQCGLSNQSESSKRPLQGVSHSTEVSPTHPSLPKRAALFSTRGTKVEDSRRSYRKVKNFSELQFYGELSQSTPSLVDPPDRSKFWLELDSVYPENVSQSYESLQVMNGHKQVICADGEPPGRNSQRRLPEHKSSSGGRPTAGAPLPPSSPKSQDEISNQMERTRRRTHTPGKEDSDSSLPSPIREQILSSDLEASGEESDPQLRPSKTAVWIVKRRVDEEAQTSLKPGPDREHWYGSEEFLALPAQLHKTEMLALKLESLTQSIPQRNEDFTQKALQDVDDWELTELNTDWDVAENRDNMSSGDDFPSPLPLQRPSRRIPVSRFSPSSSSDIAPSLDESVESGPLSDLQSEEEGRRSAEGCLQLTAPPVDGSGCAPLVQQLLEDIQGPDKDLHIWRKMECFVLKLDGFISWLQEALDSTENWTQPRQDLDSLRVYLDTHLSFKLNVDSHAALKESIMEEGKVLLSIITSHQPALKDILHMVSSQWDQLQRQIRRQHGWMLRALRCIQARLFYTSQSHEPFAVPLDSSTNGKPPSTAEDLKAELISGQWELQRAALEKMAVKLSSLKYPSSPRRHLSQMTRNNSLQEFEAEYQELWDWLMDMDAMVTDSHQLLMSEEQRQQLFKSSRSELMMMDGRRSGLLGRAASLKRSGAELPTNFHVKMHNLTHTWRQLEKILSERSSPCSSAQTSSSVTSLTVGGRGAAAEDPRSALSPLTNSLLEQLEARIKELKVWLRDTELLIFNSCLRQEKDASQQLPSFKSLCSEIQARRRGVASVLKLCQKLLQQSQSGPMAEVGPDAEQHREALQLLSINLERRWEAIVMQALQWQNRLRRELGEQQVNEKFLEAGLVDLCQISPASAGPAAPAPDDSWEWDETDMTIPESEPQEEPESDLQTSPNLPSDGALSNGARLVRTDVQDCQSSERVEVQNLMNSQSVPPHSNIFQVFSLHNVEFYKQPNFPLTSSLRHKTKPAKKKPQLLLKSISKDSSLSSVESLPDLLGGLMSNSLLEDKITGLRDGDIKSGRGQSENRPRSDSESGIVSDTGDIETTTSNSEIQAEEEDEEEKRLKDKNVFEHCLALQTDIVQEFNQSRKMDIYREKGWRTSETEGETKRNQEEMKRRSRRGGGEAVEILINGHGILTPADSDSDFEGGGVDDDITLFNADQYISLECLPVRKCRESSPVLSQSSSLESLLALGVELFPSKDLLHRSTSLESCLNPCSSTDVEAGGSLAELDLGQRTGADGREPENETESALREPTSGELSRRTLDLLKRLENIQNPLVAKMTRSVSDMTLGSSSPQRSLLPVSPSLGGQHSPLSGALGCSRKELPLLITRSSGKASLTELSSTEDSSLGSEDFSTHRNLLMDPNMAASFRSCRKPYHGNNRGGQGGQGGQGVEDSDAASLSMVVNVSCTSACTDEDEDNSDLLSSSTLTLTEEELGVRDEEDEEKDGLSNASSGNEEEEEDEEEMESSYVLGLEYMKRELQSWIRSPRSSCSSLLSKTEVGLRDELQCGTSPSSTFTSSAARSSETNNNQIGEEERQQEEENRRNATRRYISQFVDDVENGNVDQSCLRRKDEDDELLREESSVFTKKGDSLRDLYLNTKPDESIQDGGNLRVKMESDSMRHLCLSPSCELLTFSSKPMSSLVGQLRGELPCHGVPLHSPPSLSPVEDCRSQHALHSSRPAAGGRKAINIQEKFKFSSFVTEETRREIRAKDLSLLPKKRPKSSSCCSHRPSSSSAPPPSEDNSKKEDVHGFVMEIIDMASVALKNKENQTEGQNPSGSVQDRGPGSVAQIKDKILQHSHQPLHLRKGDFYSYLSLSSHDSDCGEVSQCAEDQSSSPVPYSIPSCTTPTQGLRSPSPELPAKQSERSSPSGLDLRSADSRSTGLSAPPSPDFRDEETLFAACTEEVYLGPPLCYSMVLSKKPRRLLLKSACGDGLSCSCSSAFTQESDVDPFQDPLYFQGPCHREEALSPSCPPPVSSGALSEERRPSCEAPAGKAVGALQEERSRNEGPPYLNPWLRVALIDSSAAECLADTKTLGSNMGAVMTEISVCSFATNPSKEPAAAATRINPKINRSAMRGADREDRERRGEVDTRQAEQEEEGGDGWSSSQQDPKASMEKQSPPALAAEAFRVQL